MTHAIVFHEMQPFELKTFLEVMYFQIKIHVYVRDSVCYDMKPGEDVLGQVGDARLLVTS